MLYQMQLGELPPANKKRYPEYPWEMFDKKFQWASIDENGAAWLHDKDPMLLTFKDPAESGVWIVEEANYKWQEISFLIFDRGNVPWTETKMKRPEGF